MPHIKFEDLSDGLQNQIASLEIQVEDLTKEIGVWRWGALMGFVVLIERLWDRFS